MKKFKSLSAFILTAVMIFSIQINPVAAISSEGKEKNDASASLYMQELCDEANENITYCCKNGLKRIMIKKK